MSKVDKEKVEYARRVYEHIESWYKLAENKAQILLTLDGAFLAFLTTIVITDPTNLKRVLDYFDIETYLYMLLMVICVGSSVFSALMCLLSRTPKDNDKKPSTQRMWFFGDLSQIALEDIRVLIYTMDRDSELAALTSQMRRFSRNVVLKHKWVNRGFAFLISGLLFLILMGTSYILHFNFGRFQGLHVIILLLSSAAIPLSVWLIYRYLTEKELEWSSATESPKIARPSAKA